MIILGTEPHFYDKENFKYENYCTMKAIPNQSPETVWSFEMDKVIIDHKNKSTEYTMNIMYTGAVPVHSWVISIL